MKVVETGGEPFDQGVQYGRALREELRLAATMCLGGVQSFYSVGKMEPGCGVPHLALGNPAKTCIRNSASDIPPRPSQRVFHIPLSEMLCPRAGHNILYMPH